MNEENVATVKKLRENGILVLDKGQLIELVTGIANLRAAENREDTAEVLLYWPNDDDNFEHAGYYGTLEEAKKAIPVPLWKQMQRYIPDFPKTKPLS